MGPLLPSLPCQAVGQSEQGQVPACCLVNETCLTMFTNRLGGGQRSSEEAGKTRRKAKGDGAIGVGVNGKTMLSSDLAEGANSVYSTLERSNSLGSVITVTPHIWSLVDLVLGKWGSVTVTVKKEKRKLLSFSLDFNLFLQWSIFWAESEK